MEHSHNACPVCNTILQDNTQEECDKCGWILRAENLLDVRTGSLVLNWAIRYYDKVMELEGRSKYRQDRFNKRLDDQRDDINLLQNQMKSIFEHFPKINSALSSKEIIINLEKPTLENSVDVQEDLQNLEKAELESDPVNREELTLSQQEENNLIKSELPKPHQEIISDYYHNPKEFASKYQVKIANITKDCINANRGSEEKNVVLEENNRGNYWIFNFDDVTYLVPVEDKYINQHSYTTTSTIFDGHNYNPDYKKIQLVKPAIVSLNLNTNPQTWRLQEQGELVFL
jgi:predicted nucleic acid-binding Zn ribbon protein